MAELTLMKCDDGALRPVDQQSSDLISKFKSGQGFQCDVKKHNNPQFHRKMMALFNLAFEYWNPEDKEYKGQKVSKEFNQFRSDITILAGFYDSAINFKGEVRLTAKSLNFSSMDQDERERLYQSIITVILQKILINYNKDDVENVINQVLDFT